MLEKSACHFSNTFSLLKIQALDPDPFPNPDPDPQEMDADPKL